MSQEAKDQGLANKAVDPAAAGASEAPKDQSAPAPSADDKSDLDELKDDVKKAAATVKGDVGGLLTSSSVSGAVDAAEKLVEDVKESASELVGDVKALLGSDNDDEHDAGLRAQYDATADLAARGGDSAENQ